MKTNYKNLLDKNINDEANYQVFTVERNNVDKKLDDVRSELVILKLSIFHQYFK